MGSPAIIRKTFLSNHKKGHFCCLLSSKTHKSESQGFSFAMTTNETAEPCDFSVLPMIKSFFSFFLSKGHVADRVGKHQVLFVFLM